MLTIRDLKIAVGGRTLFEKASLAVNYGDRVGLVGPNGAGKSTLFSVILKTRSPDEGVVERDEWTMTGYLPQEGEAVVHFIRRLATKVLHVNAGELTPYAGDYDYFLEKAQILTDDRAALVAA